jgi:hypothetical protein
LKNVYYFTEKSIEIRTSNQIIINKRTSLLLRFLSIFLSKKSIYRYHISFSSSFPLSTFKFFRHLVTPGSHWAFHYCIFDMDSWSGNYLHQPLNLVLNISYQIGWSCCRASFPHDAWDLIVKLGSVWWMMTDEWWLISDKHPQLSTALILELQPFANFEKNVIRFFVKSIALIKISIQFLILWRELTPVSLSLLVLHCYEAGAGSIGDGLGHASHIHFLLCRVSGKLCLLHPHSVLHKPGIRNF